MCWMFCVSAFIPAVGDFYLDPSLSYTPMWPAEAHQGLLKGLILTLLIWSALELWRIIHKDFES